MSCYRPDTHTHIFENWVYANTPQSLIHTCAHTRAHTHTYCSQQCPDKCVFRGLFSLPPRPSISPFSRPTSFPRGICLLSGPIHTSLLEGSEQSRAPWLLPSLAPFCWLWSNLHERAFAWNMCSVRLQLVLAGLQSCVVQQVMKQHGECGQLLFICSKLRRTSHPNKTQLLIISWLFLCRPYSRAHLLTAMLRITWMKQISAIRHIFC